MRARTCSEEPAVLRAARMGEQRDPAWSHLRDCPICQEAVSVARWLDAIVDADEAGVLPDPGRIYWRAQLHHRRAMAHRATRTIRLLEQLTVGVGAGATLLSLSLAWPAIPGIIREMSHLVSKPVSSGLMTVTLATALLVVTVVIGWYTANLDDA